MAMHRTLCGLLIVLASAVLRADTLLVLDTRVIESADNARLVPGRVTKHPANPLFQADKPWENSLNNLYPNVIWDDDDRVFKMWYKCVLADKDAIDAMDGPSTVHDVGWYLLYATSRDGVTWDKPALGLHAFGGTTATNIVARDCPNVGVVKDGHDPDPARRYKMVSDVGLGKPQVRFSADGIHWGPAIDAQGFGPKNGDTHNNAFWDDRSGRYVWFTKLYLGERLVARLESDDFLHWRNNGLVLRSSADEGRGSQTYCMPVFRHAGIYLGYLMMYHVSHGRTVDCELAWSPDGLHWRRVAPGRPLIPRGPKGTYDSECIYAMAGPPITREGRHLIFYGGDDFPHTGWKRHCLPCLATVREHGFAGYERADATRAATVVTRPLRVGRGPVTVVADGDMTLRGLDEAGREVPRAEWQDRTLRFEISLPPETMLYALEGVALVNTDLPPDPHPLASTDWKPAPVKTLGFDFTGDAAHWTGVDALAHVAAGDYVSVRREGRSLPIALSSPQPAESPLVGDWPTLVGGRGARISCRVRAPQPGGRVAIEIFAGDTGAWQFLTKTEFSTDWQEAVAELRYDWTDAEAAAAGWTRATNGFGWLETLRHVGKIVVVPAAVGGQSRFDLDDVRVQGVE
jgi:hypothetical protein